MNINTKRFENKISYKNHYISDESNDNKKNKNKINKDDILIQ